MNLLKPFVISLFGFLVLDLTWFTLVKNFNLSQLAEIGRIKDGQFDVLYAPAVMTYVLMAVALTFFVLPKISNEGSYLKVFLVSALMGLIVYGVFDTTNLAILKNYPIPFALVDMTWGTFAFGVVGCIVRKVGL